ncbi:hypothetical protein SLS60_011216 [Paraconiothyrium brasiliense]|uniref:RING-type domain-containing protein n=1 Tax=Paraconiothyrium brasiliense TaxID=300254 RepID=A0ABR3QKY8_9PLEO
MSFSENSQRPVGQEGDEHLPTRAQFMDPENVSGLLALSDPRTDARPTDVCAVCQEDMEELDKVVLVVPCGHIFDRGCLTTWFDTADEGTCPLCRRTLFSDAPSEGSIVDSLLEEIDHLREAQGLSTIEENRRIYDSMIEDIHIGIDLIQNEGVEAFIEEEMEFSEIVDITTDEEMAEWVEDWVAAGIQGTSTRYARLLRVMQNELELRRRLRNFEDNGAAPDAS